MPTGYTAFIEDGDITTGREFLLLCSRNFGVAIDVRDEPLSVPTPTKFEPDPYCACGQSMKRKSKKILNVPFDDSDKAVRTYMQDSITSCEDAARRAPASE